MGWLEAGACGIAPCLSASTSRDLIPVLEQGWKFLQLTFLCVLRRAGFIVWKTRAKSVRL